jgi:hypothetical protein
MDLEYRHWTGMAKYIVKFQCKLTIWFAKCPANRQVSRLKAAPTEEFVLAASAHTLSLHEILFSFRAVAIKPIADIG